jgi:hypothetical protein
MPIVTQSRTLPEIQAGSQHTVDGVKKTSSSAIAIRPSGTETTTSYRTSKRLGYDEAEYSMKSSEEMRKDVGREYRTRYDNGHEFSTYKTLHTYHNLEGHASSSYLGNKYAYTGWFIPVSYSLGQFPTFTAPSSDKIKADGRRAIETTTPTTPDFKLAAFLGELREGLPSLIGNSIWKLRDLANLGDAVGGEHLNFQFAVKPLIGDVEKAARAVIAFNSKAKQVRRDGDGNHFVRRKLELYADAKTTIVADTPSSNEWQMAGYTGASGDIRTRYFANMGRIMTYDESLSKAWFSGAFQFYLAQGHSFLEKSERYEQLANQLLGTRITADTLWQLTPWSWLIDWQADVGTFISNVTNLHNDSLVLRYGYVMHTTRMTRHRTVTGLRPHSGGTVPVAIGRSDEIILKTRTKSTPYGFDLQLGDLTTKQWSILGALGMTVGPTTLR